MKKLQVFSVIALFFALLSFSSCQIVGDIFKTGVGVGVFLVIAVIGLVIFVIAKMFGGGK